jgi:hypothetical protein
MFFGYIVISAYRQIGMDFNFLNSFQIVEIHSTLTQPTAGEEFIIWHSLDQYFLGGGEGL